MNVNNYILDKSSQVIDLLDLRISAIATHPSKEIALPVDITL